jgi:hypothetical protein
MRCFLEMVYRRAMKKEVNMLAASLSRMPP